MNREMEKVQKIFGKDQRGITGLETAIVLIAFVVVASVFAFAVITTGLFSSEEAASSAQAGVEAAKSTMTPKGSMVLAEAQATGANTAADSLVMTAVGVDHITEGVLVGMTMLNITDGSSCTVDTPIVALTATCDAPLTGGVNNTWGATDFYAIELNEVSLIKFKVTPSPGAKSFSLAAETTSVSFTDASNNLNAVYAATILDVSPFTPDNVAEWSHTWLVGSGPGIDTGDVVEFTVQVKGLTIPLTGNQDFSVEIVPQSGAALSVSRTTPLEMAAVMDLN